MGFRFLKFGLGIVLGASVQAADLPEGEYIVIVSAANRALAHIATKEVDARGGEYTFSVSLGPLSNSVPTFYACQWRLRGSDLTNFNSKFQNRVALAGRFQLFSVSTNTFTQVCQRLNLVRTQ